MAMPYSDVDLLKILEMTRDHPEVAQVMNFKAFTDDLAKQLGVALEEAKVPQAGVPDYDAFETQNRKEAGRQWVMAALDMIEEKWLPYNVGPFVSIAIAGLKGSTEWNLDWVDLTARKYLDKIGVKMNDSERVLMNLVTKVVEFPVEGEETEEKIRGMIRWIRLRHKILKLDQEALDSLSMVLLVR